MAWGLGRGGDRREHALRDRTCPLSADRPCVSVQRRTPMTWQTPTAVDFRFGFEITMYVAAR
jgi:coenzyme PQQ precursor peptide PqqA